MLIGELAKKTKTKRPTLDRYVRLGLIPHEVNPENEYREFNGEAIKRVGLIRVLRKRPFRRRLEEIKEIFEKIPILKLEEKIKQSNEEALRLLSMNDLL